MPRNHRALPLAGLVFALPATSATEIERFNPAGLSQPDGYSQVVVAKNPGRFIYLGGKAGIRPDHSFPETLAEQSRLTFANIDRALKAAGARREDVVEIAIYIVDLGNVDPSPVYEEVRKFFPAGHKPASMVIGVSALAWPGLLVEVNVRAVTD